MVSYTELQNKRILRAVFRDFLVRNTENEPAIAAATYIIFLELNLVHS